jgi:hypothetical protein
MIMTRSVLATVLVVAFATSSLVAQQPVNEEQSWRRLVAALEPAATVSVRLKDGQHIVGTILEHSNESLVLKPRTRIPVAARAIAFGDIDSIERKKVGWSPGAKVIFGIGVGLGGLMLATLVAFAAYGD